VYVVTARTPPGNDLNFSLTAVARRRLFSLSRGLGAKVNPGIFELLNK
jgi:hypothetical protein